MMKRLFSKTNCGPRLLLALLAGLWSLVTMGPVQAQSVTYSSSRRQIKACVLTFTNPAMNNYLNNSVPYTFYIMDSRSDLKPGNWDIINPLAPNSITGAAYDRWNPRGYPKSVSGDITFKTNQPLAKNMAAYWEVNLDTIGDTDLHQFDIVLLPIGNTTIFFSPEQRARLAHYVDGGGTLWFENEAGGGINTRAPFFVPDLTFVGGSLSPARTHPLLTFPNALDRNALKRIGTSGGHSTAALYLQTVIQPGNIDNTSIAGLCAGDFGAGHLIVSSIPLAYLISDAINPTTKASDGAPFDGGSNAGAISSKYIYGVNSVALKLAYNILAWTSASPTQGSNARHTASSSERIGGQLGEKWYWNPAYDGLGNVGGGSGAVLFKEYVFYSDGNGYVHCFDRDPIQSILGNGSDDGIPDFSKGTPYDEIWKLKAGGQPPLSTPTAFSMGNTDYVAVTSSDGQTTLFNLSTNMSSTYPGEGGLLFLPGIPIPAPVFSEGVLFAVTGVSAFTAAGSVPAHIVPLDPQSFPATVFGNNPSAVAPYPTTLAGGNGFISNMLGLPRLHGPISVGYVHDLATGALDRVVYATSDPLPSSTTNLPGIITGLWFSTRNEPLVRVNASTGSGVVFQPQGARKLVTWNTTSGNSSLLPRLHIVHKNMNGAVTGYDELGPGGGFTVTYSGGMAVTLTVPIGDEDDVYADYTLNWGADNIAGTPMHTITADDMSHEVRLLNLANPSINNMPPPVPANVVGGAALSSDDLAIFNSTIASVGGLGSNSQSVRIMAVRDQYSNNASSGGASIISRRGASTRSGNKTGTRVAWLSGPEATGASASRIIDTDLSKKPPLIGGSNGITSIMPVGSVAIASDVVYSVGTSSGATIVMAFRANPSLTVSTATPFPVDSTVRVFNQVFSATSGPMAASDFGMLPYLTENEGFIVDRLSGSITIIDCKLSNGDMLNIAQPLTVAYQRQTTQQAANGQQSVTQETMAFNFVTNTGGGPLDNLIWYTVIPDSFTNEVTGEVISGTKAASGPSIVGDTLYYGTTNGSIVSLDIRGAGFQHPLIVNGQSRVHVLLGDSTRAGGGAILEPPTGSERTLVVGMSNGVAALDAHPTIIADNNRLLEVDFAGNAMWSMDSSLRYSGDFTSVFKVNLARPSTVHRIGLDQFLLADTNNNRVLLTDRGGQVQWELNTFNNDAHLLPPGFPTTLNAPTDVEFYQDTNTTIGAAPKTKTDPVTELKPVGNGPFIANHYLIADGGNYRAIEITDVLDASSGQIAVAQGNIPLYRQVSFVTRSLAEQNSRYRYRTIQDFPFSSNDSYLIAAVGNTAHNTVDSGAVALGSNGATQEGVGGSLVVLQRSTGDVVAVVTSLVINPNIPAARREQRISNPTWFKEFTYIDGSKRYLLADDNGCYELSVNSTTKQPEVQWMLSATDYQNMTGRPLKASSIQRLTQADAYPVGSSNWYPRYLITNRYDGPDYLPEILKNKNIKRGQIHGEVFEIRGADYVQYANSYQGAPGLYLGSLRLNPASPIRWMFPNEQAVTITGSNGIPTQFTIIRTVGAADGATTTYTLEQPAFAERPY